MSFDLTDERKAYIEATGKVVLNACPGSGKTTTIAHKLLKLTNEWEQQYGNSGGIACLSFTNVAKNEIAEKYRTITGFPLAYPHLISTIDSFINGYITLPFVHKIMDVGKRWRIVDDYAYIDRLFENNWQFIKKYKNLCYAFRPSKVDFTITDGISWDGKDKSADADFVTYGRAVKTIQYNAGLLKTSDSAVFALRILKKIPRIATYLSARYPYLIIDEAQDTSEIQHALLQALIDNGLKHVDLVGDPYQCLYQWRDANPELFLKKFDDMVNWQGLRLTENRRSTQNIVDVFSPLRRPGEQPVTCPQCHASDQTLHILKYPSGGQSAIVSIFEELCKLNQLKNNRILVRGNTMRNELLGRQADYKPWGEALPYLLVEAKIHLESNEVKDAVRKVRRIIISLLNPGLTYQEVKDKEDDSKDSHHLNGTIFNMVRNLPDFALPVKDWTLQTQAYLKTSLQITTEIDFGIRKKTSKTFDTATLTQPLKTFFKKAVTSNELPVTTIHQAKGMTFEAILFILSANRQGQNIGFDDFIPPTAMPSEKQRLVYVAISRPQKLLCIGMPDSISDQELKMRFGDNITILPA